MTARAKRAMSRSPKPSLSPCGSGWNGSAVSNGPIWYTASSGWLGVHFAPGRGPQICRGADRVRRQWSAYVNSVLVVDTSAVVVLTAEAGCEWILDRLA